MRRCIPITLGLSEFRVQEWCQQAEATGFVEWQEVVKTIRNWEYDILNDFYWRVTNAFTEGSNNTVKVVKRRGYGYRNFDNLRRRICWKAHGLYFAAVYGEGPHFLEGDTKHCPRGQRCKTLPMWA